MDMCKSYSLVPLMVLFEVNSMIHLSASTTPQMFAFNESSVVLGYFFSGPWPLFMLEWTCKCLSQNSTNFTVWLINGYN